MANKLYPSFIGLTSKEEFVLPKGIYQGNLWRPDLIKNILEICPKRRIHLNELLQASPELSKSGLRAVFLSLWLMGEGPEASNNLSRITHCCNQRQSQTPSPIHSLPISTYRHSPHVLYQGHLLFLNHLRKSLDSRTRSGSKSPL